MLQFFCTQLWESVCTVSGAGHGITFVDNTATETQERGSQVSYYVLLSEWRNVERRHHIISLCPGYCRRQGKIQSECTTAASQMLTPSEMESFLGMCTNLIFSRAFCNSACLLVNGTEIMTVIRTPHISILTLLRIVLWYKYAWSNADLVNSGHFTLQVNECKKLLFKTRSPCPIPADIQYCKFQQTQTFSP